MAKFIFNRHVTHSGTPFEKGSECPSEVVAQVSKEFLTEVPEPKKSEPEAKKPEAKK